LSHLLHGNGGRRDDKKPGQHDRDRDDRAGDRSGGRGRSRGRGSRQFDDSSWLSRGYHALKERVEVFEKKEADKEKKKEVRSAVGDALSRIFGLEKQSDSESGGADGKSRKQKGHFA
jgi:hypothetical protein